MSIRRVLAAVPAALLLGACARPETPPDAGSGPLAYLSGVEAEGFSRADEVRPFSFPQDHGAHPDYRSEWWYFTGNLEADGRPLGFQLTVFRFALAPGEADGRWESTQLWLAQLAVSDLAADRFLTAERLSRGAAGLAGAAADALAVRVEDWTIDGDAELSRVRLAASDRDFGIELELSARKPVVLQGEAGLSRKGSSPGNASYYYSATRLAASGRVILPGAGPLEVRGSAWFDREWSTSALEPEQQGWDWFALQFRDQRELMVYQLRGADGTMHPNSAGVLVDAAGRVQHLGADQLELIPGETWRSPESGRRYPVRWTVRAADLELDVRARRRRQEHRGRFEYWEGAVEVTGREGEHPLSGLGYLEMTGYP